MLQCSFFCPYIIVHYVMNIYLLIGFVLRNPTLGWNHWLKSNVYGRDRDWEIIIGLMCMVWNSPSKASMTCYSGPPHILFPELLLNFWEIPVIEGRDLLTSLWYQKGWLIIGERICWRLATFTFMWVLGRGIGQLICMSFCWFVYTYPCCIVCLGPSDAWCWTWVWWGSCVQCRNKNKASRHCFAPIYRILDVDIRHVRWFVVAVVISGEHKIDLK